MCRRASALTVWAIATVTLFALVVIDGLGTGRVIAAAGLSLMLLGYALWVSSEGGEP